MSKPLLHGIVPALATPFLAGGETIDDAAAGRLIEFLVGAGVHGIFALGSTGEAVLLSQAQRLHLAELVMARVRGRLPVYIHVGALRPAEVIELARHAERIGASGIAVLPPYYYN